MFSRIMSAAIRGISVEFIFIETDYGDGMPAFDMVGLLNSEVREAKERVRTALKNSQIEIPPKRIMVNLSPADIRKEGNSFDLPIAVGILKAMGMIGKNSNITIEETLIVGELSLDGRVNKVRGILPIVLFGKEQGIRKFLVPKENVKEGAMVPGVEVFGVESLMEVIALFQKEYHVKSEQIDIQKLYEQAKTEFQNDFADMNGQEALKRAAEVAAAGMHNLLMIGPPGSGKTMLASRISSILPMPDLEECMEITKIQSITGTLSKDTLITKRPFRSPHHSITTKALVGGGSSVQPGELTLAHKGVLFLDELPEFRTEAIEALRQPIEKKKVVISRLTGVFEFPCDVMLVAAANPCRCGYYPDRTRCHCSEYEAKRYLGKISGPVLDRMDICVGVSEVKLEDLQYKKKNESSKQIRKRVEAARFLQKERYKNLKIRYNSELSAADIEKYCYLGVSEQNLMKQAFEAFHMSARGYYKIIRVARTIADLEGSNLIRETHLAQALGYRMI